MEPDLPNLPDDSNALKALLRKTLLEHEAERQRANTQESYARGLNSSFSNCNTSWSR